MLRTNSIIKLIFLVIIVFSTSLAYTTEYMEYCDQGSKEYDYYHNKIINILGYLSSAESYINNIIWGINNLEINTVNPKISSLLINSNNYRIVGIDFTNLNNCILKLFGLKRDLLSLKDNTKYSQKNNIINKVKEIMGNINYLSNSINRENKDKYKKIFNSFENISKKLKEYGNYILNNNKEIEDLEFKQLYSNYIAIYNQINNKVKIIENELNGIKKKLGGWITIIKIYIQQQK